MIATKARAQASTRATSKLENSRWILKPTPFERPRNSTTSTIFQISAMPDRAAAAMAGANCGRITWRSRATGPMRKTRAMSSSAGDSARAASRRITATVGILFSATARIAAVSFSPIQM